MTVGSALGGVVGGTIGGIIRQTMTAIGIGIFICAMLDIFLVFTRDTIFNVAPEAYDAGFLTKTSVALSMALIPYLLWFAAWLLMLMFSALMFLFSAFQTWTWIMPFDPPNILEFFMEIVQGFFDMWG